THVASALSLTFVASGLQDANDESWGIDNVCISLEPDSSVPALQPVLKWAWNSSPSFTDSRNVIATPAVIDLDHDGIPEVIFATTTSSAGAVLEPGVLRVVDGRTGSERWTASAPAINAASPVAVGDIDGDGTNDIIAVSAQGTELIAFNADG